MIVTPYITPNGIWTNALFLQPTTYCARNCNGCYVKGFEKRNGDGNALDLWTKIFTHLNNEGALNANQITMALDSKGGEIETHHDAWLNQFFILFQRAARSAKFGEFHLTTHTKDDILNYLGMDYSQIDVLSISKLTTKDIEWIKIGSARKIAKHINWNLTLDPIHPIEFYIRDFERIAEVVDSVYLVLHKPSTGMMLDMKAWELHQNFQKFLKKIDPAIRAKINIDGCIGDSKRYLSTGYGCSSNVSRFQIWPDGSVSGCPYSQTRITPPASTLTELLNNVYSASKMYEFSNCKIPSTIDPKHSRVSHNYLEIIE